MALNKEQVTTILRAAVEAVDEAQVPNDLKAAAFTKAAALLAGETPVAAKPGGAGVPSSASTNVTAPSDSAGMIATRLEVDPQLVSETYNLDGDEPALGIGTGKLDTAKTKATREIALLIAAARQATGLDEYTEAKVIRRVADNYGRLDDGNFAATMGAMDDIFTFKDAGRNRKFKLKVKGFEEAATLIKRIHGQ